MRRCNEWSIDVQADAYKCGQGAAWVLAALHMSNARITIFLRVLQFLAQLQFLLRGCKDPGRPCHADLRFKYLPAEDLELVIMIISIAIGDNV